MEFSFSLEFIGLILWAWAGVRQKIALEAAIVCYEIRFSYRSYVNETENDDEK